MDNLVYWGKFYPFNTLWFIILVIIFRILFYYFRPYLPNEETYNV
jgi:hypothetical protein